jgi:hypothetical protein
VLAFLSSDLALFSCVLSCVLDSLAEEGDGLGSSAQTAELRNARTRNIAQNLEFMLAHPQEGSTTVAAASEVVNRRFTLERDSRAQLRNQSRAVWSVLGAVVRALHFEHSTPRRPSMSHTSEDRVLSSPESQDGATIIPFERPQSELQKAVQQRALDQMERVRKREEQRRRPNPLRVAIVAVLAAIPVILIFGAVDKFLTAVQKFTASYESTPAQSEPQAEAPAQIESSSEPGMVFLQPNLATDTKSQGQPEPDQKPSQQPSKK